MRLNSGNFSILPRKRRNTKKDNSKKFYIKAYVILISWIIVIIFPELIYRNVRLHIHPSVTQHSSVLKTLKAHFTLVIHVNTCPFPHYLGKKDIFWLWMCRPTLITCSELNFLTRLWKINKSWTCPLYMCHVKNSGIDWNHQKEEKHQGHKPKSLMVLLH
jgi:hypothetical protein